MEIKVIKRDGSIVAFDKSKIENAILKAMKYGIGLVQKEIATDIADSIANEIEDKTTIYEIEKNVYDKLIDKHCKDVARAYEGYRSIQSFKRNNHPLDASILGLTNYTNEEVLTENSNKQSYLASTQRDLIAGEVSKHLSLTRNIPTHIVQAHNEGIIKLHDLDYFLSPITNCELVPLDEMFKYGTVINKKMIETPKSLRTATTLATQIAAQVSSFTYGGQTMSLSHLAPFVRVSKEKIRYEVITEGLDNGIRYTTEVIDNIVNKRLKTEIKDSVQTFNYQLSTLNSVNGQSPFLSLVMYINENPEYEEETAMLIEEFLKQRIDGMKNEFGVKSTQTFPKLLFFLDENNIAEGSKYYYLKKLAIKATAKRMNPDFISAKVMREVHGHVFGCMGCRSFLSPWKNNNEEYQFYGRGNLGVTTLNLVHIALSSNKDMNKFWEIFDNRLELAKESLMLRYEKLRGVKAEVAPILWCHGVFARLDPEDEIIKEVENGKFSISLGYSGIYETVKYLTEKSHTSPDGLKLAKEILMYMNDRVNKWKDETGLGFGIYGTPQESTTGWFSDKLKAQFGEIDGITDKGWITNSYHVDIRENINAFEKLSIESELQKLSLGGNVSYIEVANMESNLDALEQIVDFIYNNNIYAEINTESDVCGVCHYSGKMDNDKDTLEWVCPQCKNRNQSKLSVVRRSCGYLGETTWSKGRKLDILNRVKHI